jgi:hypothetical protein
MVTRKLMTALAAGVTVGLLAQHATGAEAPVVQKLPVTSDVAVDVATFRAETADYLRALNEQLRTTLNEELRRELAPKVVLATYEARTQG